MAYTTTSTASVAVTNPIDADQPGIQDEALEPKGEGSGSADGKLHKADHDSPAGLPYTSSLTSSPEGVETPNHDVPDGALLVSSGPRTRPDILVGNEGAVQANMQIEAMPAEIVLDERYDRLLYSDLTVAHVEKGADDPRPEKTLVERTPGGTRAPLKPEGVSVVEDPKLAERLVAKNEKAEEKAEAKVDKALEAEAKASAKPAAPKASKSE